MLRFWQTWQRNDPLFDWLGTNNNQSAHGLAGAIWNLGAFPFFLEGIIPGELFTTVTAVT